MKKPLILIISLIAPFAGCENEGAARRTAKVTTPLAEHVISAAASAREPAKTEEVEQATAKSQLDEAFELKAGVYGLPFGATTEEVMEWCADNNMVVVNPTEKDVKEAARRAVGRIRDLKEAYDFEMAVLTPLEQELLKLAQGYAETRDVFELAKIAAAQEKLDVLKNPTVLYDGQKYYLKKVHKGMKTQVDAETRTCTDDRITKTAYRLELIPGQKSEKMIASGLKSLDVFLYGEIGRELRTYASLAILGSSPHRSMDVQFELVMKGISEKYGSPGLDVASETGKRDIRHLLGSEFDEFLFFNRIVWARNVLLLASVSRVSPTSVELGRRATGFAVLYFDHEAATRMLALHEQAIEDRQKNYHDKKEEALAQIQQNF